MTIAAGVLHRDGILLCADTQQESGAMKVYGPKVGSFPCPGGRVAFAFAGNVAFASSAVSKCSYRMESAPSGDFFRKLEETLDKEYRRVVFAHPSYPDWTLAYSLILAIWSGSHGVKLFVTHENTLREVSTGHQCIGMGQELGHYLAGLSFAPNMREQDALLLAAYMLARVKDHVPGCGGPSQFLALRNDGTVSPIASVTLEHIERNAKPYEFLARSLLFAAADGELSDEQFEEQLNAFIQYLRTARTSWRESESNRKALVDALMQLRATAQSSPSKSSSDQT